MWKFQLANVAFIEDNKTCINISKISNGIPSKHLTGAEIDIIAYIYMFINYFILFSRIGTGLLLNHNQTTDDYYNLYNICTLYIIYIFHPSVRLCRIEKQIHRYDCHLKFLNRTTLKDCKDYRRFAE